MKKIVSLCVCNIIFLIAVAAQTAPFSDWQKLEEKNRAIDKNAMYVLGSWALLNMAYSGISLNGSDGATKSYHQMNIGWNAVNATLAGFALFHSVAQPTDITSILENHYGVQKIFLLNTGLDVAYMLGGAYLMERGKNATSTDKTDQLNGFGKSVIVNGAFLFALDLTTYLIHNAQNKNVKPLLESGKIGLSIHF